MTMTTSIRKRGRRLSVQARAGGGARVGGASVRAGGASSGVGSDMSNVGNPARAGGITQSGHLLTHPRSPSGRFIPNPLRGFVTPTYSFRGGLDLYARGQVLPTAHPHIFHVIGTDALYVVDLASPLCVCPWFRTHGHRDAQRAIRPSACRHVVAAAAMYLDVNGGG